MARQHGSKGKIHLSAVGVTPAFVGDVHRWSLDVRHDTVDVTPYGAAQRIHTQTHAVDIAGSLSAYFSGNLDVLHVLTSERGEIEPLRGFGGPFDWLALMDVNAPLSGPYVQTEYVGVAVKTRTWTVMMPVTPSGAFVFRLFRDNDIVLAATSATVVVTI